MLPASQKEGGERASPPTTKRSPMLHCDETESGRSQGQERRTHPRHGGGAGGEVTPRHVLQAASWAALGRQSLRLRAARRSVFLVFVFPRQVLVLLLLRIFSRGRHGQSFGAKEC